MKVTTENSISYKACNRIKQFSSRVILRHDLDNLGNSRQVSRALLKTLIKDGEIVKIGYGI